MTRTKLILPVASILTLASANAAPPRRTLATEQKALIIELEDAEHRKLASILQCDASAGKAIEFREAGSEISIAVELVQSRKAQL